MSAMRVPPGPAAYLTAGLAAGYAFFHWWVWDCQHRAFPALRGTYPAVWTMPSAHRLTLVRLWRLLTSPLRRLPDVYIIGAPKSGTSALFTFLAMHPKVKVPLQKESRFLEGFCGLHLSKFMYRSLFPTRFECPEGYLTLDGDATAAIMPELSSAMYRRMTPNAKIILSCREPCDAAFSLYKMRSRIKGRNEHGLSLRDMYDLEMKLAQSDDWRLMNELALRLDAGASSVRITPSMPTTVINSSMLRGFYYENVLGEFHKRFDPKNMLLLRFKDFAEDTEGTVRRVFKFLGLQEDVPLPDLKTIRPEDVMDMELEKESRTKKLSAEDKELLERHFQAQQHLSHLWC